MLDVILYSFKFCISKSYFEDGREDVWSHFLYDDMIPCRNNDNSTNSYEDMWALLVLYMCSDERSIWMGKREKNQIKKIEGRIDSLSPDDDNGGSPSNTQPGPGESLFDSVNIFGSKCQCTNEESGIKRDTA